MTTLSSTPGIYTTRRDTTPLVTLVDYRYVPDAADFFVEEPSVEDLTAAALAGGHIATRTPRTRTIQEDIQLVRIALV